MCKIINILSKIILAIIDILCAGFGVFAYTTEYLNNAKFFLDEKVEFSRLFVVLITCILLNVIGTIAICLSKKSIELENERDSCKSELFIAKEKLADQITKTISDNSKDTISEIIDIFLSNYADVLSIQIYECKFNKSGKNYVYEIKPTLYYKTREGEVANLIHERYCIPNTLINEFNSVKTSFDKGNVENMARYIARMQKELNKKLDSKNKVNEIILYKYLNP